MLGGNERALLLILYRKTSALLGHNLLDGYTLARHLICDTSAVI